MNTLPQTHQHHFGVVHSLRGGGSVIRILPPKIPIFGGGVWHGDAQCPGDWASDPPGTLQPLVGLYSRNYPGCEKLICGSNVGLRTVFPATLDPATGAMRYNASLGYYSYSATQSDPADVSRCLFTCLQSFPTMMGTLSPDKAIA